MERFRCVWIQGPHCLLTPTVLYLQRASELAEFRQESFRTRLRSQSWNADSDFCCQVRKSTNYLLIININFYYELANNDVIVFDFCWKKNNYCSFTQNLHYKLSTWRSTTLKADKIHRYIYTTHNIYPPFTLVQRISSIFKDHLWYSHLPGTYSQWEPPPTTVCDQRQTAHI